MVSNFKKFVVIASTMSLNSVLCVTMYIGNLSTYLYSLHFRGKGSSESSFDIDPSWMLPMYLVTRTVGIFGVDHLTKMIGLRATCGLGIIIFVSSIFVTYFTVTHSVWATTLSFMIFGGVGNGIAFTCNILYITGWFGSGVGMATALPLSSSPMGGLFLNLAISSHINPDNLAPDLPVGNLRLFSQRSVTERIPTTFLLIGAISALFLFIGFIFLQKPPTNLCQEEDRAQLFDEAAHIIRLKYSRDMSVLNYTSETAITVPNVLNKCATTSSEISNSEDDMKLEEEERRCQNDKMEVTMTPLQVLKSESFYILECSVIADAMGLMIAINYFKLFGQLWIEDDQFLSFVASCASMCIIPLFLGCGFLMDRVGLKITLLTHLVISSISLSLWHFTAQINRWLYLVWTVIVHCIHNDQFVLFPLANIKLFGRTYFATNYGLTQIASVLMYFVGPPLISFLLSATGWFWLFFTSASISFVAMNIVMLRMPSL